MTQLAAPLCFGTAALPHVWSQVRALTRTLEKPSTRLGTR